MIEFMGSSDCVPELIKARDCHSIPLKCWQDVNLSTIWIPSHLLPSRNKIEKNRGIFHALEKKDAAKCIESFSVYIDQDEKEIFQSDSEPHHLIYESNDPEELENSSEDLNALSTTKHNSPILNNLCSKDVFIVDSKNDLNQINQFVESNKSGSRKSEIKKSYSEFEDPNEINSERMNLKSNQVDKSNKSDSYISLNDILDTSQHLNIKELSYYVENKSATVFSNEKELKANSKKERKNKKKTSKYISLDQFLDDGTNTHASDESCFDEFYRNIMLQKNGYCGIHVQNNAEFPDLVSKDPVFIKSNKPFEVESQGINFKSVLKELSELSESAKESEVNKYHETEMDRRCKTILGKFFIENIPAGVSEDDVCSLLFSYGEIESFSMQPTGSSFKVYVEMNLICDIDWIIECLNGSEPFGAASETLKCYKV